MKIEDVKVGMKVRIREDIKTIDRHILPGGATVHITEKIQQQGGKVFVIRNVVDNGTVQFEKDSYYWPSEMFSNAEEYLNIALGSKVLYLNQHGSQIEGIVSAFTRDLVAIKGGYISSRENIKKVECFLSEEKRQYLKQGEFVKLRSDLVEGKRYGGIRIIYTMTRFIGKHIRIDDIGTTTFMANGWNWTFAMVESIGPPLTDSDTQPIQTAIQMPFNAIEYPVEGVKKKPKKTIQILTPQKALKYAP